MDKLSAAELERMLEEATVDCYDEDEQVIGLFTMAADNLVTPFRTRVLGVEVTVKSVEVSAGGEIVALCARDRFRQAVPILDLPLPEPPPEGWEWIAVYRYWLSG